MKLKYQIPDLYQSLFPSFVLEFEVTSKAATCDSCAMSKPNSKGLSYKENLKCCTYFPFEPNYLIGAALKSGRIIPSAKKAIDTQIEKREYALPIGLLPSVRHQVRFNARTKDEFGNREDWLCPYYDRSNNNCGMWKFRSAVCTTFFCLTDYGKVGEEFWQQFQDYLTYVEMALLEESLVNLDFSPRQISENLEYLNRFEASENELKSDSMDEKTARKLWNGYFDDQAGFYIKCFEFVSKMKAKDFTELMGEQGMALQADLLANLRRLK